MNQGPTGTVENPKGSNPTSPSMDPSRVPGAVVKGSAMEGPAFAQASAEGDAPEGCFDGWEKEFVRYMN